MKRFLSRRSLYTYAAIALIATTLALIFGVFSHDDSPRITATVETGPVRQVVSVTGAIRAENTAELGFAAPGIVKTVHVRKGDVVATGTPLISLDTAALAADVLEARSALASAQADLAELRAGVRSETRTSSEATVQLKTEALARTKADQERTVENARRALLSGSLAAITTNTGEDAPAPTISGTYLCREEGTYTLAVFSSQAPSGYSLRLSGLESGTFAAATDQSAPFGTCGLRAQFTPGFNYHNSVWTVTIPNRTSAAYVTSKNAYDAAVTNAASAIAVAERELTLTKADAAVTLAPARSEDIARAEAAVAGAAARLARAEATANDAVLNAPFAGTVVSIDAVAGETIGTTPVVTLLSADRYELIARIPEIDVSKLRLGQSAEVVFDTAVSEILPAVIDFISPEATVIDGVAYYEARLALTTTPPWIRSGLNADVDIIISETTSLRLPRRFVTDTAGTYTVLVPSGTTLATTTVEIELIGNDGYIAIKGLPTGTTVVAP
jgi:HlyD family secretion protein